MMTLYNGTVNGDGDVILIQIQNLVFGTVGTVLKTRTESFLCVYQTTSWPHDTHLNVFALY